MRQRAYLHLLRDEAVQPAGVDAVGLEALGLQQLDEVLHRGPEVPSDGQLLEGHHHVATQKRRREGEGRDAGRCICFDCVVSAATELEGRYFDLNSDPQNRKAVH